MMPSCRLTPSFASEGHPIEFVEEQHAWRGGPRGLERGVEVAFAHPQPRIEDLLDAYVDERQAALTGCGACKERLAAAGWAVRQDATPGSTPVTGDGSGRTWGRMMARWMTFLTPWRPPTSARRSASIGRSQAACSELGQRLRVPRAPPPRGTGWLLPLRRDSPWAGRDEVEPTQHGLGSRSALDLLDQQGIALFGCGWQAHPPPQREQKPSQNRDEDEEPEVHPNDREAVRLGGEGRLRDEGPHGQSD